LLLASPQRGDALRPRRRPRRRAAGWRQTLDLYVLYHRLELSNWWASLGRRESLDRLAEEMRALVAA
jgi:hypothetical protein